MNYSLKLNFKLFAQYGKRDTVVTYFYYLDEMWTSNVKVNAIFLWSR